jgi:inorganic pyrophosphatase/exopolyphosphatase
MSKYTKVQLEDFFFRQYDYIEGLNERIMLLQEQNTIYRALNKKLTEEHLNLPKQKVLPKKKVKPLKDSYKNCKLG